MALWLVAVVVAAAAGVVPSGVAGAGSNNTISGTVSAEGGGPLVGIDVRLYAWPSGSVVGVRTSDVSGGYSFAGLADGAYRVNFSDQVAGAWETEVHAGAAGLATAPVVVESGGAAT
ncbi:MAG: carboxypeptidase regulatory-like domain-containing protein, partial [Acidimicrobiales bacterium]|nr:carboxypeptidase regulatory-like domain-containing protein [Acidimicrobiales bacterium]